MKLQLKTSLFFVVMLVFCLKAECLLNYMVEFKGVESTELDTALRASSELLNQSEHTATSLGVLKRRSEADVANFVKVMHWLAYYNASISYKFERENGSVKVIFTIDMGPVYPLANFKIGEAASEETPKKACDEYRFDFTNLPLDEIGITLGTPAYGEVILHAEEALLQLLAQKGYPEAVIKKRDVVADQKEKVISVNLVIDSGMRAQFGKTTIVGNTTVHKAFFHKKIAWREGEIFNLCSIKNTQEELEASGLFSSMIITQGKLDPATGELPMEIQVSESKHRSIAAGVGYMTGRGVGGLAEWDHRNMRGMGERMSIHATVWKDTQDGRVSYVLPDFRQKNQDLIFLAEVEHEVLEGYTETSFSGSAMFENKINKNLRTSYGGMYKWISIQRTDNNGIFHLLKAPLQVRWSTANCLLDPTSGYSLNLKTSPTMQVKLPSFFYCPVTLTGTFYQPLTKDHRFVIAGKAVVGTIFGESRHDIPPSERFYSGTENTLRGYKYLTVSPLGHDNKPTGGRSIMVFSFEGRMRISEQIGLVGFYEVGNVYKSSLPEFDHQQLQSVGAGLRYHTPIGPIRFDIAFPLVRRNKHLSEKDREKGKKPKKFDSLFEAYMSIGQSF